MYRRTLVNEPQALNASPQTSPASRVRVLKSFFIQVYNKPGRCEMLVMPANTKAAILISPRQLIVETMSDTTGQADKAAQRFSASKWVSSANVLYTLLSEA